MLKIYNTLSQKIEILKPRAGKKINFFVCGPTVYDFSHLGHARTYLAFDMFVNYLKHCGFEVFYLQNITDIDDKIIQRAQEKNISWRELSRKFEKEYFDDIKSLKIKSVNKYARATAHIKEIISQVECLLQKGFAYQTDDGIYYNTAKFKNYGKLSKRTSQSAEDGVSRIDEGIAKKNKGDFCLWKFAPPAPNACGEPKWQSPWGLGRPGWHIEDTAITEKFFGTQYDIHGGARDLIFPHHEAEICQMEAVSGKAPLVKYWMHTGFLTINGQKMSKSLGNFTTIRDFLKQNSPEDLRFIIFSSHYRSPIDFKDSAVQEAKANIEKLQALISNLQGAECLSSGKALGALPSLIIKFWEALNDDFNTPKAKAILFELVNWANERISKNQMSKKQANEILKFFQQVNKIFLFLDTKKQTEKLAIPAEITKLVQERETARQQKNWQLSDQLRKQIEKHGWQIEDTPVGPKLKK